MGVDLPTVDLAGFTPVQLTAGDRHACALDAQGKVKCWGANSAHQVAQPARDDHRGDAPDEMGAALDPLHLGMAAVHIDAGADFTCAVGSQGQVKCWGEGFGAVPVGINMQGFEASRVGAGAQRCVLDDQGAVQCWAGFGVDNEQRRMHRVELPRPIIELATSAAMTCVLDVEGELRCWGRNPAGQLGQGDRRDRTSAEALDLFAVPLHDEQL